MVREEPLAGNVVVANFRNLFKKFKPPPFCAKYSMLRARLEHQYKIYIKYPTLVALLKTQSIGYKLKKKLKLSQETILFFFCGDSGRPVCSDDSKIEKCIKLSSLIIVITI